MRQGITSTSREGKAHHNSTQAVLCVLAAKGGTVRREIQAADGVADVS